MSKPPPLQRFIEDELERAPLLLQDVIGAAIDAIRRGEAPTQHERQLQFDLQRPLTQHTTRLITQFVAALRQQIEAGGRSPEGRGTSMRLSLMDDAEVAADVEVSRAIEAIHSVAEAELRELRSYIAALAGDVDVARDSNPLRPEVYARALWDATQALPVARGYQIALMHHFVTPLARALRAGYAAAAARLEDQGVVPSAYRTIILPPGSRSARPSATRHDLSSDMNRLRETMPAPLLDLQLPGFDDAPAASPSKPPAAAPVPVEAPREAPPPSRQQLQLRALMQRLFEAILADPVLPPSLRALAQRLEAPMLRVALAEPGMIDNESHAAWRFLDRLAFAAEVPLYEEAALGRLLRVAEGLVDHIARAPAQDEALYRWAGERLDAFDQHALQQRRSERAAQIDSLRALEAPAAAPGEPGVSPSMEADDAATLETVPAKLLDHGGPPAAAPARDSAWLEARRVGDVLRVFRQGQWKAVQLLWHSDLGGFWLVADLPRGRSWALRRSAVERLWSEGLISALAPRSLVHDAAERVLRQLENVQESR